jgi:hypothetical protein
MSLFNSDNDGGTCLIVADDSLSTYLLYNYLLQLNTYIKKMIYIIQNPILRRLVSNKCLLFKYNYSKYSSLSIIELVSFYLQKKIEKYKSYIII